MYLLNFALALTHDIWYNVGVKEYPGGVCLLTKEQIEAIEKAIQKGYRVEILLTKDGVKLLKVQRNELKTSP